MKTPDEIKKGLRIHISNTKCANVCPYDGFVLITHDCLQAMCKDALDYIRQLEAQIPKWNSVEEQPPKVGERVLVVDDFGVVGTGRCEADAFGIEESITIDGCSRFGCVPNARYWMPMPEPPKED